MRTSETDYLEHGQVGVHDNQLPARRGPARRGQVLPFARTYSPDALGRPTQVSGHASAVAYHPNGAIAGYTLANGVVHSSTQNTRGLPLVWRDAGVVQDAYAYDANANVTAITDQQEGLSSRSMTLYDGLDRLRTVSGIWGAGSFTYDALDNLRTSAIGPRSLTHNIDAATNRLTSLTGSQNITIGYDVNGNVTSRGTQGFTFDIGNRLQSAPGKASYSYDGHGRRIWVAYTGGSSKLQVYGQGGKLLYSQHSSQGNTRHVYLGERLIAEVNSVSGTSYSHTDALGSPVARTSATGVLQSRTRYEPYGATAAGTNPTGIGYTGHVNDADTGLVYMQQRYMDPVAGRFLSVDPVVTNASDGSFFGRYHYANNNPYRFKDPDGRSPHLIEDEIAAGGGRAGRDLARGLDGRIQPVSVREAQANLRAMRAEQLRANEKQGKAGEEQVKAKMGSEASGCQVCFRTSDGSLTRVDITKGTTGAVEVKTGNGQLTTNQSKMQADVEAGRAVTPVGQNARDAGFTPGKPVQLDSYEVVNVKPSK